MDEKSTDSSSVPEFTCFVHHFSALRNALILKLEKSKTQEPVEMFDLEFNSSLQIYNYENSKYNYKFELRFYNNLHEIRQNYYYEIILKASQFIDEQPLQIQTLLSIAKNRISEKIYAEGSFALDERCVNQYTLYIRRYKDFKSNHEIKKGDSIGTMLWNTGTYSDISLIVGDQILRVHKEVLSQKSEVFEKMFVHEMLESENGIIKIDDLDVEVVQEMMSYIYTGRAGNVAKMPRELFEAAHKYQLHELQSLCEEHIIFSLNNQNVIDILEIANLYDLEDLRKGIMSFVQNHEKEMVEEPSFRSFLCSALKISTAVGTLLLADRYKLYDIERETLKFIKEHVKEMMVRTEFLELFKSHPELIRNVFKYIYKIESDLDSSD